MQRDTLQNCVIHNCKIVREGASEYQTSPHFLSIYFIHLTYLSVCCVLGGIIDYRKGTETASQCITS